MGIVKLKKILRNMKRIYTYIIVIILTSALLTSCVIDDGSHYEVRSRAIVICERTVDVMQDYMLFADVPFMFNEYLKTEDQYKSLLLDSHMKGWKITPDGNNWSITLHGRRYIIYPGAKPIDEVGSEWRIARLHGYYPSERNESFDLCYIR